MRSRFERSLTRTSFEVSERGEVEVMKRVKNEDEKGDQMKRAIGIYLLNFATLLFVALVHFDLR